MHRYKGLKVGKNSKLNSGFWGQECGPELDETPELKYKYMEDAISVNTGKLSCIAHRVCILRHTVCCHSAT